MRFLHHKEKRRLRAIGGVNTTGVMACGPAAPNDQPGVRAGTKYAYRVRAWNEADGVGPKSNFVNVTTRQPPEPDTPEPEPVDPNTVACSAGNDSQWITSRSAFTRSGYTYYGCDVTKKFDKSQGPEKRPRYQVLSCDTNWKCGWKNG